MAAITDVTVDCANYEINVIGTSFASPQVFTVLFDTVFTAFTLVANTATTAQLRFTNLPTGDYCIGLATDAIQSSGGDEIQSSDEDAGYVQAGAGTYTCNAFNCAISVSETSPRSAGTWKLYRFDLKVRTEDTA